MPNGSSHRPPLAYARFPGNVSRELDVSAEGFGRRLAVGSAKAAVGCASAESSIEGKFMRVIPFRRSPQLTHLLANLIARAEARHLAPRHETCESAVSRGGRSIRKVTACAGVIYPNLRGGLDHLRWPPPRPKPSGVPRSSLYHSAPDRITHEASNVVDVKLLHDPAAVGFGRFVGDV
jgi:hypothetical protein